MAPLESFLIIKIMELIDKLTQENIKKIEKIINNKGLIESLGYKDFYFTKNNLRFFIKENMSSFFKLIEKGDKIIISEKGILYINGYADNFNRKYIKILAKNKEISNELIEFALWKFDIDLYCKIKKNNPIKDSLIENGFQFYGDRGQEILYKFTNRVNRVYRRKK